MFGLLEAEGDSVQYAWFGVGRLDERVADALLQGVHDDGATLDHGASHLDERDETTSYRSSDPTVEQLDRFVGLKVAGDGDPELLLNLVDAPEAAAVALEGRELGLLSLGQVLGVLQ
jgi:hypothetical protein